MNNLSKRIISGTLFVIIMVAGILLSQFTYGLLMMVIMLIGMDELYTMALGRDLRLQRLLAMFASMLVFIFVNCICAGFASPQWISLCLIPVLAIPISFIFNKDRMKVDSLAIIYAGMLYVALPVALSPFIVYNSGEYSGILLLSFFILIWMSDVGAYCIGSWLGKRPGAKKMAPAISPKKSWAGFIGGIVFCIIGSVVLYFTGLFEFNIVHCIAVALITGCTGVCGDLFESLWKRHYGVKDSGNIIPGHGGILDRFDSSLVAIPLAAIYLISFNLI